MKTEQKLPDWTPDNLRAEIEILLLKYEISGEEAFIDIDIPLRAEDEIVGELTILEKAINTIILVKLIEVEACNFIKADSRKTELHTTWLKPLSELNSHIVFSRLGIKPMYLSNRKGFLLVKGKRMLEARKARLN